MKRILSLLLAVCLTVLFTVGCSSSGENEIVGKWYNDDGKCLSVRSDHTWKLEDSYGTGTWKLLDDGEFEFTDYYGDTQESEIESDEHGEYIDFGYYGDFYRDEYPDTAVQTNATTHATVTQAPTESTTALEAIDPFEGLEWEVYGISPYVEISLNTQNCTETAQRYITYSLDKEYYANGETATLTASLSEKADPAQYTVTQSTMEYSIQGLPEYVTSLEGLDLSELKAELSDYVDSEIAKAATADRYVTYLGHSCKAPDVSNLECPAVYFSTIKTNKDIEDPQFQNRITFIYTADCYWNGEDGHIVYSAVSAVNIVKHPDGSIKWGYESLDAKDFNSVESSGSVENTVAEIVMCNKSDYNISEVTELFK